MQTTYHIIKVYWRFPPKKWGQIIQEEYSITINHIQGPCKELLGLKKFHSTLRNKNILHNCYLIFTGFCVSSSSGLPRGVHRSGPGVKKPCKRIHRGGGHWQSPSLVPQLILRLDVKVRWGPFLSVTILIRLTCTFLLGATNIKLFIRSPKREWSWLRTTASRCSSNLSLKQSETGNHEMQY